MKFTAEPTVDPTYINEYIYSSFRRRQDNSQIILTDVVGGDFKNDAPNFLALQVTLQGKSFFKKIILYLEVSTIEIHYLKETQEIINFDQKFNKKVDEFRQNFKKVFPIPNNVRKITIKLIWLFRKIFLFWNKCLESLFQICWVL